MLYFSYCHLFIVYKHIAIAIENPFTLSDAGISKVLKFKSPPSVGLLSSTKLDIPPAEIDSQAGAGKHRRVDPERHLDDDQRAGRETAGAGFSGMGTAGHWGGGNTRRTELRHRRTPW